MKNKLLKEIKGKSKIKRSLFLARIEPSLLKKMQIARVKSGLSWSDILEPFFKDFIKQS